MLTDLKTYLMTNHRASINELALRFEMAPDAVRGMLDHWIRKGKVARVAADAAKCGGCCACDTKDAEYYQWVSGNGG